MAERKPNPYKKLPEPFRFSGKGVFVSHQTFSFHSGLVPKAFKVPGSKEVLVSILLTHFNRCYTERIVKIVDVPNGWGISDQELDIPDTKPWFLVGCYQDTMAPLKEIWLIVNDEYEFYPMQKPENEQQEADLKKWRLLHQINDDSNWREFSEVDRMMVDAAIQAYLRKESWLT